MNTTELIEELEAFDPNYKTKYKSLRLAAKAAGLDTEFDIWVNTTADGEAYRRTSEAHDHVADNMLRWVRLNAERTMSQRNELTKKRGFVVDGDGV